MREKIEDLRKGKAGAKEKSADIVHENPLDPVTDSREQPTDSGFDAIQSANEEERSQKLTIDWDSVSESIISETCHCDHCIFVPSGYDASSGHEDGSYQSLLYMDLYRQQNLNKQSFTLCHSNIEKYEQDGADLSTMEIHSRSCTVAPGRYQRCTCASVSCSCGSSTPMSIQDGSQEGNDEMMALTGTTRSELMNDLESRCRMAELQTERLLSITQELQIAIQSNST